MSAHALNDPHRRIVIQDELESFFHVLLYYAIRFLPHTLNDNSIGRFLQEYFDGYSPGPNGGYLCGSEKFNAMVNGVIRLPTYNGITDTKHHTLKFLWPAPNASPSVESEERSSSPAPRSSPCPPERQSVGSDRTAFSTRSPSPHFDAIFGSDLTPLNSDDSAEDEPPQDDHPINDIISELLTWFQAYYALDNEHTQTSSAGSQKKKVRKGVVPDQESEWMDKVYGGLSRRDPEPDRERALRTITAEPAEYEALREKLKSHHAIISLFRKAFQKTWPLNDKGVDKKPRGGYARPKSAVPSDSAHTGEKRRSMDDDPEDRPPSKRSKP